MLPDAVINPRLNLLLYPSARSAGISRPPMATMVTPDAPVKAVNTAHDASATSERPPGKNARESRTRRSGARLCANR